MLDNFDLLSNLPYLFFAFCFFVVFILFLWGGIVSLRARGKPEKVERGRKILSTAFAALFIILLIVLVFYLVTYFLKKGEAFKPSPEVSAEFPPPFHLGIFSPAPQFIGIGNYYFTGPWLLKSNSTFRKAAIYAILCKKNGDYDILYIGDTVRENLLKHGQYRCWMESCNQNLKNLYIAIFWAPSDRYPPTEKDKIEKELKNQFDLSCPKKEVD